MVAHAFCLHTARLLTPGANSWPDPRRALRRSPITPQVITPHVIVSSLRHWSPVRAILGGEEPNMPMPVPFQLIPLDAGFDVPASQQPDTKAQLQFRHRSTADAVRLVVRGSSGRVCVEPMKRLAQDQWELTLSLGPGRHEARFYACNHERVTWDGPASPVDCGTAPCKPACAQVGGAKRPNGVAERQNADSERAPLVTERP